MTIFDQLLDKYIAMEFFTNHALHYEAAIAEMEDYLYEGDITRSEQAKIYQVISSWLL